jgi:hypothetical protein
MGLNPNKLNWFDKVDLQVEAQASNVVVDDDGDLNLQKGGANPYMKILRAEKKQQLAKVQATGKGSYGAGLKAPSLISPPLRPHP